MVEATISAESTPVPRIATTDVTNALITQLKFIHAQGRRLTDAVPPLQERFQGLDLQTDINPRDHLRFLLDEGHTWQALSCAVEGEGVAHSIVYDQTTHDPLYFVWDVRLDPKAKDNNFLSLKVPYEEVKYVPTIKDQRNESGRVISKNDIIAAVKPDLQKAMDKEVWESARKLFFDLPPIDEERQKRVTILQDMLINASVSELQEMMAKRDELPIQYAAATFLDYFAQTATMNKDTFIQMSQYGDRSYDYVENQSIGNDAVTAIMRPENKIFSDEEGQNVSLPDYLKQRWEGQGVHVSIDFEELPVEDRDVYLEVIKTRAGNPHDIASSPASMQKLNYISDGSLIPTITISYDRNGKLAQRKISLFGIASDWARAQGGYLKADGKHNDGIFIQVDKSFFIEGPSAITHEVDHAVRQVADDALHTANENSEQDYTHIISEGTATYEHFLFEETQASGWKKKAKADPDDPTAQVLSAAYSLDIDQKKYDGPDAVLYQAHKWHDEDTGSPPASYKDKQGKGKQYHYVTGYYVTRAIHKLLPQWSFELLHEQPADDSAWMIDLDNAVQAIHEQYRMNAPALRTNLP